MIKLLFNTLSIYLCIRILKNQNYGIGINHSQRHFFYYHTSTPIGSLPVRSRQLLRTMFSSFSTILRLFSLEAFQRRRASSLVNFVVSKYSSSYFILVQHSATKITHILRNHQENHKKSATYHQITTKSTVNYKLLTVNYKLLFPTSASYNKAVPSRKIWRGL